jgi:hypothetical protein
VRSLFVHLFLFVVFVAPAYAETNNRSIDQHFYSGNCELPRDPIAGNGTSDLWLMSCIDAHISSEGTFAAGDKRLNTLLDYGSGYVGLHLVSWLSLHAKGHVYRLRPMKDGLAEETRLVDTDYAIARLGNPVLNKYWLSVGRNPLPFGIDYSNVVEFYQLFEDRSFWASPRHSLTLHYDTQTDFFWELGVASDRYIKAKDKEGKLEDETITQVEVDEEPENAIAFRTGYDIAALTGSRLMGSFYAEESGVRRAAFGFVNVSRKGDTTQFELIRRFLSPHIGEFPFEQLVRFGYEGSWRDETRFHVQFDDNRFVYRMGTIGHDWRLWDYFMIRLNIMMHRDLVVEDRRYKDQWYTTLGLEAHL